MEHPIPVRVVYPEEERELGWGVALSGGFATLLMTSSMRPGQVILGLSGWLALPLVCIVWTVGTLLAWRRRPTTTLAREESGAIVLGTRHFRPHSGLDISVARAASGFSVAVGRAGKGDGVFVEVETEDEARALVRGLGGTWGRNDAFPIRVRRDAVRAAQRTIALAAIACWIGYGTTCGILESADYKATFGVPGLVGSMIASALFAFDGLLRRRAVVGEAAPLRRNDAIEAHLRLHRDHRVVVDEPRPPDRVRVLTRGRESTSAWLARIDGLGASDGGYRGDALTAEELWHVVEDAAEGPDARLGAARLLARRHGATRDELRLRVEALEDRVDAVLEDSADEAASLLTERGPAFRAER